MVIQRRLQLGQRQARHGGHAVSRPQLLANVPLVHWIDFEAAPTPAGSALLALDNVVLSPHVAYNTPEAARTLHDIAVECIERYFAGDPVNVVAGPA